VRKRIQVTFDAAACYGLAGWWYELLGYRLEDGHDFIADLLDAGTVSTFDVVIVNDRLFVAERVAAKILRVLGRACSSAGSRAEVRQESDSR
jgi:hypothetical protein